MTDNTSTPENVGQECRASSPATQGMAPDRRSGFTDANGLSVKEGDEVEYRIGARRGTLVYCGHDGAALVRFFDSDREEDVNWRNLCGVPPEFRTKR